MKKTIIAVLVLIMSFIMTACDPDINAPEGGTGEYSTQNRMTTLEYSIYINKQITVFASELNTRMQAVMNHDGSNYSLEAENAKSTLKILKGARNEVEVTYPSTGKDEYRESLLKAMQVALDDMQDYIDVLEGTKKGEIKDFQKKFKNDYNELTGMASLYAQ